jgi:hypothetical protein
MEYVILVATFAAWDIGRRFFAGKGASEARFAQIEGEIARVEQAVFDANASTAKLGVTVGQVVEKTKRVDQWLEAQKAATPPRLRMRG